MANHRKTEDRWEKYQQSLSEMIAELDNFLEHKSHSKDMSRFKNTVRDFVSQHPDSIHYVEPVHIPISTVKADTAWRYVLEARKFIRGEK
jgi:hypothetical protein